MPELIYKDRIPSSEEFLQDLQHAMDTANPIDDLLMLTRRLYE